MTPDPEAGIAILRNVKLADHCRFRVGGPADYFVEVKNLQELRQAIGFARVKQLPVFVYGGGSNLFFDSAGFRGLVVRMGFKDLDIDLGKHQIKVGAGFDLPELVRELAADNLGGVEFLGNIPGSVGGAVIGNAGCYGKSISEVLVSVDLFDINTAQKVTVGPEQLGASYRQSVLKNDSSKIVLGAVLQLTTRPTKDILSEVEDELGERLVKHPHHAKCAGSFFKNPPERAAWQVIAEIGLANAKVGGAMISPKHSNFLINAGGATSRDIIELTRLIQKTALDKLNVVMEPEVRYVGPTGLMAI
ncbi:MAG: UDP-N-acetylmuramate dehydrogenase [bacterium]